MKRIDERKLYHRSNFHKRWFSIDFSRAVIDVKVSESGPLYKQFMLSVIRGVRVRYDEETVELD